MQLSATVAADVVMADSEADVAGADTVVRVGVPATRSDILHPCDVMEVRMPLELFMISGGINEVFRFSLF